MLQSVLDTTAMTEQCIVLEPRVTTQLYNVPEAEEVAEYCAFSQLLKQLHKCQMLPYRVVHYVRHLGSCTTDQLGQLQSSMLCHYVGYVLWELQAL